MRKACVEEDPRRRTWGTGAAPRISGSMADPGYRDGAEEILLGVRRGAEGRGRGTPGRRRPHRPLGCRREAQTAQARAMIDD
jgi:hypothetical protein